MKVYIVTHGSYSDYRIDKVFLNKKKAERYVETARKGYDEPRIEEYETHDDKDSDDEMKCIIEEV